MKGGFPNFSADEAYPMLVNMSQMDSATLT